MKAVPLTKAELDSAKKYFQTCIDKLEAGEVDWWAISMAFHDGSRIAIHSEDAPARPRGLS